MWEGHFYSSRKPLPGAMLVGLYLLCNAAHGFVSSLKIGNPADRRFSPLVSLQTQKVKSLKQLDISKSGEPQDRFSSWFPNKSRASKGWPPARDQKADRGQGLQPEQLLLLRRQNSAALEGDLGRCTVVEASAGGLKGWYCHKRKGP